MTGWVFRLRNWWHGARVWRVTTEDELDYAVAHLRQWDVVEVPRGVVITTHPLVLPPGRGAMIASARRRGARS